jgi:hypothetical protein
MAKRRGVKGDIDAIRQALRPRMKDVGGGGGLSTTIPPHTHHASAIIYEPEPTTALLSGDDVQEVGEELGTEKLARSGEQPWLGPDPLDMAGFPIINIDSLSFELDPENTPAEGDLQWNPASGVDRLEMVVSGGSGIVKTPVGGVYVKVRNVSGAALPSAAPVVVVSVDDTANLLEVEGLAYSHSLEGYLSLGLTLQSIADDAEGWVCCHGYAGDIDLSAFTAGDSLYVGSVAGTMDTLPPGKGCGWRIKMGTVIVAADPGSMFVRVEHRANLDELSNVETPAFISLISGDVPKQHFDVPMWLPPGSGEGCDAWRDSPANRFPISDAITADYEIDIKDVVLLVDDSGGDVTMTLPDVGINPHLNVRLEIKKVTGVPNRVIIVPYPASGDTIEGETEFSLVAMGEVVTLQGHSTANVWRIL